MPLPARLILIHGLGYFRWTQWLAVAVLWVSLWAMLAAFALVNFQEQGFGILETLGATAERLPWLPSLEGIGRSDADGALYVDDSDVRTLLVRYWALGAALCYIGSLVLSRLWPSRRPWSFRRRLATLAGLGAITWLGFVIIYATSGETFHGSTLAWLLTFTALCGIVTVASIVPLTLATLAEWVAEQAERAGDQPDTLQPATGP